MSGSSRFAKGRWWGYESGDGGVGIGSCMGEVSGGREANGEEEVSVYKIVFGGAMGSTSERVTEGGELVRTSKES